MNAPKPDLDPVAAAHVAKGDALMAAGSHNEAFAAFHAAIQAAPGSVVPRVRLGSAFLSIAHRVQGPGGPEKALGWAENEALEALAVDFWDPSARRLAEQVAATRYVPRDEATEATAPLFERAFAAWRDGRVEEARQVYESILAVEPEQPAALKYVGNCYLRMERLGEAEAWFRRAVARRPHDPQAYLFLSTVMQTLKRWDDYEQALIGAVAAHPRYWTGWMRLSAALGTSSNPRGLKSFRLIPGKNPGAVPQVAAAWQAFSAASDEAARAGRSVFVQQRSGLAAMAEAMTGAPPGTNPWEMFILPFLVKSGHLDAITFLLFYRDAMRPELEAWKRAASPAGVVATFVQQARLSPV